jgi:acetyl esterase
MNKIFKVINFLVTATFVVGFFFLFAAKAYSQTNDSQASELKGFFRSGQTFLTWKQIRGENVRYRIYRSDKAIKAFNQLSVEMIVATVNDYTGFNWMGSTNRRDIRIAAQAGKTYVIPKRVNYIIEDGKDPLPENTGLFVYTAKKTQTGFYVVTAIINGKENKTLVQGGNSLTIGIKEKVEPVSPVKQNIQDWVHWTDNVGTQFYPAMSSLPGVPYIFRVKVPTGEGPFCLIGNLHGSGAQYNSNDNNREEQGLPPEEVEDVKLMFDSPNIPLRGSQIKIEGFKMDTLIPGGWYGYFNTWGNGSGEKGELVDYHARRVLWGLEWAQKTFKIDPERVALEGGSMGGIGVVLIGLKYPERFSAIRTDVPPLGFPRSVPEDTIRSMSIRSVDVTSLATMRPIDPFKYIKEHPEVEFPFIEMSGGRTDLVVGFKDKPEFAKLAQEMKIGYQLYWRAGGHGGQAARALEKDLPTIRTIPEPKLSSLRRDQSFPALANCTANDDFGTVDIAVPIDRRPAYDAPGVGDLVGTVNGEVNWDRTTIVDEPDRYGITLNLENWSGKDKATADVTPRRVQKFKPAKGTSIECRITNLTSGETLLSKTVVPDKFGFVTVKTVPLTKTGIRLEMRVIKNNTLSTDEITETTIKRPLPTFSDVKYGPDLRNILDVWLVKSDKPTPLVVFIHGGGFTNGSKAMVNPRVIKDFLTNGVSVIAINYRYLIGGVSLEDILHDCARSIQFVRFHASDYNIDPARIASFGASAGASTSLWLAFHPDLADPKNSDPVLRESSRLVAAGAINPQASCNTHEWQEFMGPINPDWLRSGEANEYNSMESFTIKERLALDDLSMLKLASKDDPPVFLYNARPDGTPATRGDYVHHPGHVRALKARCDQVGIPATIFFTQAEPRSQGDYLAVMEKFFFTQFRITPASISTAQINACTKFGVFVNDNALNWQQKADVTDSLNVDYVRLKITVSTFNGISEWYDLFARQKHGYKFVLNLNWNENRVVPNFPRDLTLYGQKISQVLSKYQPELVVIENEQQNKSFHPGESAKRYVDMLKTASPIVHAAGLKMTDGGIYGSGLFMLIYRDLFNLKGLEIANSFGTECHLTSAEVGAARTPNSSPGREANMMYFDTILNGVNLYCDYANIHLYINPNPVIACDVNSQKVWPEIQAYIKRRMNKECITNETCVRNSYDVHFVEETLDTYRNTFTPYVIWYSGESGAANAGSKSLQDPKTGILRPTGHEFRTNVLVTNPFCMSDRPEKK